MVLTGARLLPFVSNNFKLKFAIFVLFRLFVSVYFNIIYLLNFESFPTQIRSCGANICYISAGLAGLVEPHIISLIKYKNIPVNLLFVCASIVGLISNCWLKETFRSPPPEVI